MTHSRPPPRRPATPTEAKRVTENLPIGPFVLTTAPRGLLFRDEHVDVQGPALEVLAAIACRPDGVAPAQLWPLVSDAPFVDEERLCELVGQVNTTLGHWSSASYIAWYPDDAVPRFALVDATRRRASAALLPARRTDIIGRDEAIARVVRELGAHRFVTILAAGGMGKTTVALAAAHDAAGLFPDGVCFVDLAPVVDAEFVVRRVAAAAGCAQRGDTLAALQHWARDRRALFVLDSCEHVIDAAASVAEALAGAGPGIAVLATSREPLRAAGEWLYRLAPMALPEPGEAVSRQQAVDHPALRLFIERATAADAAFVLRDSDVGLLVSLCTRLDGIALAIEIVAARAPTLGLEALTGQLERLLLRLPARRRTAPARHSTLAALLDWSFNLLSPLEQWVLQRLSVFRNGFTLEAAVEVVADASVGTAQVREGVLDLVAKSLVAPARGGEPGRLRLLDTTRAYAGAKLQAASERHVVDRRHAQWLASALAQAERQWNGMTRGSWLQRHAPLIDDVRAALDWAFAPDGDFDLGIELTITSFALGRQMLLVDEFTRRVERAMEAFVARGRLPVFADGDPPVAARQMQLLFLVGCIGTAQHVMRSLEPTLERLVASLPASTPLMDRFGAFNSLWALAVARADFKSAGTWAGRLAQLAGGGSDPVARLVANRIQAQNLHYLGHHTEAMALARQVLGEAWRTIPLAYNPSPVELRVSMRMVLARALWMQGFPARAAAMAHEAMEQARTDSPVAQFQAIVMGALPLALWCGHDDVARGLVYQVANVDPVLGFGYWVGWGKRYADVLALRRAAGPAAPLASGAPEEPDEVLADHLATLDDRWLSPRCIERVETGLVGWCAPEALRRQGERALREGSAAGQARGEALLQRSLAMARRQSAGSWELRTATSLARHWQARDAAPDARALLEPVVARFTEGFDTTDWRAASDLLATL